MEVPGTRDLGIEYVFEISCGGTQQPSVTEDTCGVYDVRYGAIGLANVAEDTGQGYSRREI